MEFRQGLLALFLVALTLPSALPAPHQNQRQSCSPAACRNSQESKLKYEHGKTYVYGFETEVTTQLVGASDEISKIKVKGSAHLIPQSPCDYVLSLQTLSIQSPSGQAISKVGDGVEGSSVRFALGPDGVIEDICVSPDDPSWSANIKRALVSKFQNKGLWGTTGEAIEVDISGRCPTEYFQVNSGDNNKWIKSRNLNRCSHREGGVSVFHGVPYNVAMTSEYNSVPLINSTLQCEQQLKNGIYSQVICQEEHQLQPLSNDQAGVSSVIKSRMTLQNTESSKRDAVKSDWVQSSILYDHSEEEEASRSKNAASAAVDQLNKLCREVSEGTISAKVPQLFLHLKKLFRSTRKDDLKHMYEQINSGKLCSAEHGREKLRKLFLDAAAMSASDGTIGLMSELIRNDELDWDTKQNFYIYTTFAPRPGHGALKSMSTLLMGEKTNKEALLAASGMAHQYCKMTNQECGQNQEYSTLVDLIARQVSERSEGDESKVLAALQALGNLDQLTPEAVQAIQSILKIQKKRSMEGHWLKAKALDAFRRDPCQHELKSEAMQILKDLSESSELRILSYLAVMRCGSDRDVEQVQKMLNAEQSNQVGSFITSHIDNILSNNNPSKKELKAALGKLRTSRQFPNDPRKFSRNYEASHFDRGMNLGGVAEGNLIFSQDSYVPRSASANLTIDLFGRSYNVLEMGAYMEDFEHMFEDFFGPNGRASRRSMNELVKEGRESWRSLGADVRSRIRRDASSTSSSSSEELDQAALQHHHNTVRGHESRGRNGHGDVYMRVLGTAVMVETFDESNMKSRSMRRSILSGLDRLMDGAKDHKFDLTEPFLFLDDEVIIPTISGWPLNLNVEGTAIISLQLQGNMDISQMLSSSSKSSDLKTRILPSAATLVKAKLTVGAGPIESGIQLEGRIHTASGIDVGIQKKSDSFELKLNIPQERIQVVDLRTNLYWVEQSATEMTEQKTALKMKKSSTSQMDNKCTSKYASLTGLRVCADVSIPSGDSSAPYYPLTGPTVLSLAIEKVDPQMEGYYLKVVQSENGNEILYSLEMDTPGSKTNRKIHATSRYTQSRKNPKLKIDVQSPWDTIDILLQKWNSQSLKGYQMDAKIGKDAYAAKALIKKENGMYEPLLEYSMPSKTVTLLDGKVKEGNDVEFKLRIGGEQPPKIRGYSIGHTFSGIIKVQPDARWSRPGRITLKDIELVSNEMGRLKLDGNATIQEGIYGIDISTRYGKTSQYDLAIQTIYQRESSKKSSFEAKMSSSQNPLLNFDINWRLEQPSSKHWESELKASRGSDISLNAKHIWNLKSGNEFKILNEIRVVNPKQNIDFTLKANADKRDGQRTGQFLLKAGNPLEINASFNENAKAQYEYEFKSMARWEGTRWEFTEVAQQKSDSDWNIKMNLAKTPGDKWETDTDIVYDMSNRRNMKYAVNSKITSTAMKNPVLFKAEWTKKEDNIKAELDVQAQGVNWIEATTELKMQRRMKEGTLKLKAKDWLEAEASMNEDNSKSHFKWNAKWLPSGRKIEGKSDLELKGQNILWDADLKWDADKDASKRVAIRSDSSYSRSSATWVVSSKNEVTVQGKKSQMNIDGTLARDFWNGESSAQIFYQTPNNNEYSLAFKNAFEMRSTKMGNRFEARLSIPQTSGPIEITWNNRATGINTREYLYDVLTDLKVSGPWQGQQENIHLKFGLASKKPGNYRSYSAQMEVSGTPIESPISAEYSFDLKRGLISVVATGRRGSQTGGFKLDIEHDTYSAKKRIGVTYKIETPYREAKTIEGKYKMTYFFKSWRNFEITEQVESSLNGADLGRSAYTLRFHENELEFRDEIDVGGRQVVQFIVNGRKDNNKFSGSVQVTIDRQSSKVNVELDNSFPNVNLRLNGASPYIADNKPWDLKVVLRSNSGGQSLESDIVAKLGERRMTIVNKLEIFPQRKAIDIGMTASNQPARRLYIALEETEKSKWDFELLGKWGDGGKMVTSKGLLAKGMSGAYDVSLSLDSPRFEINKWHTRISKKLSAGRNSITFSADEGQSKLVSILLEYAKKDTRSGQYTYDGMIKVDVPSRSVDFAGNFRVEDTVLERKRDGEQGRKVLSSVQMVSDRYPLKIELLLKNSNMDKQIQATFCNTQDQDCRIAQAQFKRMKDPQESRSGEIDWTLRLLTKNTNGAQKHVEGFQINMRKTPDWRQVESSAQFIYGEEKARQIGWRVWRNEGEMGIDAMLPNKRTMAVEMRRDSQRDAKNGEISLWMDKEKNPQNKMSVSYQINDQSSSSATEGYGRVMKIVVAHPDMKDMQIRAKYIRGGSKTIWDAELELDLFKKGQQIIMESKLIRSPISKGDKYNLEAALKSKGQNINLQINSELKNTRNELVSSTKLIWANREGIEKNAKFGLEMTPSQFQMELLGAEPIFRVSTNWNQLKSSGMDSEIEIRHEFLIPGMKDSRVYEMKLSPSYPTQTRIKMFKSGGQNEWYGVFFGLKNQKHFNAEIYEQSQVGKEIILDLDLALNNSRLLFVKADWERQNLKKAMRYMQERIEESAANLKDMSASSWREVREELKSLRKNLKNSIPELSAVSNSFEREQQAIWKEIDDSQDTKQLQAYYELAEIVLEEYGGSFWETMEEAKQTLERWGRKMMRTIRSIPEIVLDIADNFPQITEFLFQLYLESVDFLVRAAREYSQRVADVLDWIAEQEPDWLGKMLYDTTHGIGKWMKRTLSTSLHMITQGWKELKVLMQETLDRPDVQEALRALAIKYEDILSDTLDEVKDRAEELKNWLLRNLPAQEAQELIQAIATYVEQKANQIDVNDAEAQREIYEKFIRTIKKYSDDLGSIDLEEGLVLLNIPLPKDVESLSEIKDVFNVKWPKSHHRESRWQRQPTKVSLGMQQIVNSFKSRSRSIEDSPPSNGFAFLVASHIFRTFDGHVYDFKGGDCQYILTSDFVDRNFSIVIDYHSDNTKSIIVTDHTNTVVIRPDASVVANSKEISLPMTVGPYRVAREWDWVVVQGSNGLRVACGVTQDVCTFQVSGYYHGKMGGLLGTFNNEHFDDWKMPSGKIAGSISEMTNSWKVGNKCVERPVPAQSENTSSSLTQKCHEAFTARSSSLRPCFSSVNPEDFLRICQAIGKDSRFDEKRAVCTASLAYVKTCQFQDVSINTLPECVSCQRSQIPYGQQQKVQEPKGMADIVIVRERKECTNEFSKNGLPLLQKTIRENLAREGWSDVSFGLIEFGGAGEPEVHTNNLISRSSSRPSMHEMIFQTVKASGQNEDEEEQNSPKAKVLQAIQKGVEFPWRSGANKAILLMSCSECAEDSQTSYSSLKEELREKQIRLHVLSPSEIRFSKQNLADPTLIGFNATSTFRLSDAPKPGDKQGDASLRKWVSSEKKDMCTRLSQEVSGSWFSLERYNRQKPEERLRFAQVVGGRVAGDLISWRSNCFNCHCGMVDSSAPRLHCSPCQRMPYVRMVGAY